MTGRYENKEGAPPIEYGFGGGVLMVDGGMIKGAELPANKGAAADMSTPALQGWAVAFNKPHTFKGGIDVFAPGAFDETLASRDEVKFQVTHTGDLIATTNDRLELISDRKGLAFRLVLEPGDGVAELVRDRKMEAISPGYRVLESEQREADGVPFRLIKRAKLTEISLVRRGAVRQTFATLIDAAKCGPLVLEMKGHAFAAESAFARLMRALQDNKDSQ